MFSTHHPAADWQTHSPGNYFATLQVTSWRRPLTAMTRAISQAGSVIDRLVKPAPLPGPQEREPAAHRRLTTTPRLLLFRLIKPARTT